MTEDLPGRNQPGLVRKKEGPCEKYGAVDMHEGARVEAPLGQGHPIGRQEADKSDKRGRQSDPNIECGPNSSRG